MCEGIVSQYAPNETREMPAIGQHRRTLSPHVARLAFPGRGASNFGIELIEEMQVVLDEDHFGSNTRRPHQGRGMNGRKTLQAFTQRPPSAPKTKGTNLTKFTKLKAA